MTELTENDFFVLLEKEQIRPLTTCEICSNLLKSPMTSQCGHSFCKKCIEPKMKKIYQCPNCNTVITKAKIFPNNVLEQMIEYLNKTEVKPISLSITSNPFASNGFTFGKAKESYSAPKTDLFRIGAKIK